MGRVRDCEKELEKMRQERDSWKETALIVGDPKVMRSIEKSLRQISAGKAIPLAEL